MSYSGKVHVYMQWVVCLTNDPDSNFNSVLHAPLLSSHERTSNSFPNDDKEAFNYPDYPGGADHPESPARMEAAREGCDSEKQLAEMTSYTIGLDQRNRRALVYDVDGTARGNLIPASQQSTTFDTAIDHADVEYALVAQTQSIPVFPIPLPDDILKSPLNRFLWSHFVNQGSKMFLCWDPEHSGTGCFEDPYTTVLASMAISSKPVRIAALGLSAFLYNLSTPDSPIQPQASRFGYRAVEALCSAQLHTAKNTSSLLETIATAMLLFLFDLQASTNMLQLARSAAAYMLTQETPVDAKDSCFEVVMHLLRWSDICTQCSLIQSVQLSDDYVHRSIQWGQLEQSTPLSKKFNSWVIHPLYTFSTRWINPLLKLGRLVRLRRNGPHDACPDVEESIEYQIDILEEDLRVARNMDLEACMINSKDHPDLLRLNEAMYSAVILLFYTRLRDVSWTAPLIRRQVKNICEELARVSPLSRTSNNIIFPLYTAGCEAVDMTTRAQIEYRMRQLPPTGYWFNQTAKLTSSLHHIWVVRDNIPGATWMEWSQQG
jgi:hypothetical protein